MAEREIIAVEAGEQINGLIRRLRQSGAHHVTFVVPEAAAVLRNPVNLRLLRFYAEQEEKQVRLVTGDAVVQRLADDAGVEWTATPEETPQSDRAVRPGSPSAPASEDPWALLVQTGGTGTGGEPPARELASAPAARQLRRQPSLKHLAWLPALLLLLAGWQLWAGPSVVVTIEPALRAFSREVNLRGELGGGEGTVALNRLEQPVEATGSVEATGHRRYGVAPARGTVTFLNQNAKPVTIPAGTVLVTAAGTAFRTAEAVKVPGVTTDYYMKIPVGVRSGQAEGRVTAATPGSEGNVGAGRLTRFKDGAPAGIQVTNPEPARGGEDRSASVVTAADVDRARQAAQAALTERARPALEALLGDGRQLIPESVRVGEVTVEAGTQANQEAAVATAAARGVVTGLEYEPGAAREAAVGALAKAAPDGFTVVPGSASPGAPRFVRVEAELAEIVVPVSGSLLPAIDPAAIRQAARGKARADAEAAIREVPGVGTVSITGGGRRLPSWSSRLKVKITAPAGGI